MRPLICAANWLPHRGKKRLITFAQILLLFLASLALRLLGNPVFPPQGPPWGCQVCQKLLRLRENTSVSLVFSDFIKPFLEQLFIPAA